VVPLHTHTAEFTLMLSALLPSLATAHGALFGVISDIFQTTTPYKPSTNCTSCGAGASCCYDPLVGPASYACFEVHNCAKITDESEQSFSKLTHINFESSHATDLSTARVNCTAHAGCTAMAPTAGTGGLLYQQLQWADTRQALLLLHKAEANGSVAHVATCSLAEPLAALFASTESGKLFGVSSSDGMSLSSLSVTAHGRVATEEPPPNCSQTPLGFSLPLALVNATTAASDPPPRYSFNSSSDILFYVPVANDRKTIIGVGMGHGQVTANLSVSISMATLSLAVSSNRLLAGGGGLMCGQKQGQRCMIAIDVATGKEERLVLDAGPFVRLGVLFAPSAKQPLIAWQTETGMAQTERIILLDWSKPVGAQAVFNSSFLPDSCTKGAIACINYAYVFVDP
jgi:hypothetical protein